MDKKIEFDSKFSATKIQMLIQKSFTVCIETWYEALQRAQTLAVVSALWRRIKHHHHCHHHHCHHDHHHYCWALSQWRSIICLHIVNTSCTNHIFSRVLWSSLYLSSSKHQIIVSLSSSFDFTENKCHLQNTGKNCQIKVNICIDHMMAESS